MMWHKLKKQAKNDIEQVLNLYSTDQIIEINVILIIKVEIHRMTWQFLIALVLFSP